MKSQHIFNRHVDFALICLDKHEKGKPFHPTLHRYFKENKQFGSRDRKRIKNLCYDWFRLGYSLQGLTKREQVFLAFLIVEETIPEWLLLGFERFVLPPSWLTWGIDKRLDFIEKALDWSSTSLFPVMGSLSDEVDRAQFVQHQLTQSLVWVRCKNENEFDAVKKKLPEAIVKENQALGVVAGHYIEANGVAKQVEIQDYSSQKVYGDLSLDQVQSVWDCCCASGGKSLLLLDRLKAINVYGSDNRKSILSNFISRTGRHRYRVWSAVVDLAKKVTRIKFSSKENEVFITNPSFDLIIADVPCSGSGTWNRNPEFKYSFNDDVSKYCDLQREIVTNAWYFLKPGGRLMYSTCSVYAQENENLVKSLMMPDMEVLQSGYIHGYAHQSDSMFFAELQKI